MFRKTKSIKESSFSFICTIHSATKEWHDNNDGGRDAGAIVGVCFFMVFGALIEYACVGYTAKRIQLRKNRSLLAPSTISLPARATFSQTNKTTLKYIWLLHFSVFHSAQIWKESRTQYMLWFFTFYFRFLAMQKLAEEKKAEALKHMNSMPQELDLKRHGPDGYGGGGHGCRPDPRTASMPRQHPKQVGREFFFYNGTQGSFGWNSRFYIFIVILCFIFFENFSPKIHWIFALSKLEDTFIILFVDWDKNQQLLV